LSTGGAGPISTGTQNSVIAHRERNERRGELDATFNVAPNRSRDHGSAYDLSASVLAPTAEAAAGKYQPASAARGFAGGTAGWTPGTAVLRGKRLFVRVKCPHKIGHVCRTTAQGLLRKHRPATLKRTVRLRSGKSKLLVLRVKPKARR
jgi:hypothetical protein